jgi:hypothetical protein
VESIQRQGFTLAAIIVLVSGLVVWEPLTEAQDEYSALVLFGPESVFGARFDQYLVAAFGAGDGTVDLEEAIIIEKTEQFGAEAVAVETCSLSGLNGGQIDGAGLVADNHFDGAPRAYRDF